MWFHRNVAIYVDQDVVLTWGNLLIFKLTPITERGTEERGHACCSKRVHQVQLLSNDEWLKEGRKDETIKVDYTNFMFWKTWIKNGALVNFSPANHHHGYFCEYICEYKINLTILGKLVKYTVYTYQEIAQVWDIAYMQEIHPDILFITLGTYTAYTICHLFYCTHVLTLRAHK